MVTEQLVFVAALTPVPRSCRGAARCRPRSDDCSLPCRRSLSPCPPGGSSSLRTPGQGSRRREGRPGTGRWWWWWWRSRRPGCPRARRGWRAAAEGCAPSRALPRTLPPPPVPQPPPQTRTPTGRLGFEWRVVCTRDTSSWSSWATGRHTCSDRLK